MDNAPRFVVLQFEDGHRFDYEPPLEHPADIFLELFAQNLSYSRQVGAVTAWEEDEHGRTIGEVVLPVKGPDFP